MGEDFWDNLLPQIVGDIGVGGGGMPGEFDVGDVFDVDSDEDEGEPRIPGAAPAQNDDGEQHGGDDGHEGLEEDEESSDEEETPPVSLVSRIIDFQPPLLPSLCSRVGNALPLQAFPVRIWQNLVNRFWGGTAPEADNDDANIGRRREPN